MTTLPELKAWVRGLPGIRQWWAGRRRAQLHREYDARRERYAGICREKGLSYDPARSAEAARGRIAGRGFAVRPKAAGDVHTFAFIPSIGWHSAFLPDLKELGPTTCFDYLAHGYRYEDFWSRSAGAAARRKEMLGKAREAAKAAHRERPIDWIFVYANGLEITSELVDGWTRDIGAPTVNLCLDDKQSWAGPLFDGRRIGQVDIAAAFDLSWTSATVACGWYLAEGARPLYLPEGFDQTVYRPMTTPRDLPVSFIGGNYGFREDVVRDLRRHGIPIEVFGGGWGTKSVWGDEQVRVINRSVINLGMGGIGYSEDLTNVKTRDFEIPGAGGGMYLTSYNADLAQHFDIGREIACYRTRDEMIELIRHYLARPEEAAAMSQRARKRCLAEHRWLHRYRAVLTALGVLGGS